MYATMNGMETWASSAGVRRSMQANRPRDTKPEVAFRSALHRAGLRYVKHRRPVPGLRCEPDILFPAIKLAVFFDGCFWHACPVHRAVRPLTNAAWWDAKLRANVERDRRNDTALESAGWGVLRLWEHEQVDAAVTQVTDRVSMLRARQRQGDPIAAED